MPIANYETVFIAQPDITNEQVEQIVSKIKQAVTAKSGSMTAEDRWGRRRLAYPIQGHREGFYSVLTFTAEGAVVSDLEHLYRVTDAILRHLTVKVIKKNKKFAPRRERPAGAAEGRPPMGRSTGGYRGRTDAPRSAPSAAPAAATPPATPAAEGGTPA